MASWEYNSTNMNYQIHPSVEYVNSSLVNNTEKFQLTIDNYYPFATKNINFYMDKVIYHQGNETYIKSAKNARIDLKAENITIQEITSEITYSNNRLNYPKTFSNPPNLENFSIPSMSRNNITISWTYNTTESNNNPTKTTYKIGFTLATAGLSFVDLFRPIARLVPYSSQPLFIDILFFLSCTLTGLITAMYTFGNQLIKEHYLSLKIFKVKNNFQSQKNIKDLKQKIEGVLYSPNLLGAVPRLFLGLSLLIYKLKARTLCNYKHAECIIKNTPKFGETLSEVDISEKSVSDLIPESKTILAVIAVLTTIGVSFSFSAGAIAPILLSIGAFYVFLNIGSTFYIFGGKSRDIFLPLILLLVATVALSFNIIFYHVL